MKRILFMISLNLAPVAAFAQGSSGVGGGGFTEPEMKGFMSNLVDYFATKDYSGLFPEVTAWERDNQARFADFIADIEPKVVNHPVYFPEKVERDCVSRIEKNAAGKIVRRWFECNAAKVPASSFDNQPKLYMLLAHEAFIHAGIEKPGDEKIPSTYEKSPRFLNRQNLSVKTFKMYIPGADDSGAEEGGVEGVHCQLGSTHDGAAIWYEAIQERARLLVYYKRRSTRNKWRYLWEQQDLTLMESRFTAPFTHFTARSKAMIEGREIEVAAFGPRKGFDGGSNFFLSRNEQVDLATMSGHGLASALDSICIPVKFDNADFGLQHPPYRHRGIPMRKTLKWSTLQLVSKRLANRYQTERQDRAFYRTR